MSLKHLLIAAPLALTACSSDSNEWDKVWEYTCKVQKGTWNILTNQIVVWNQVFTTNPDTLSRFDSHNVKYRLPNVFNQTWGLDIHFITNQAALDNWDKIDLGRIVDQINNIWWDITVLLEWYADARGSDSANERMATKRIKSVEKYINSQLHHNVQVTFENASFGETAAQKDISNLSRKEKLELRKDRKVVVSISGNTITAWLDRSPADAYILDASGSMKEPMTNWETRWSAVTGYSFPKDSSVFTFTSNHSNYDENDCSDSLTEQKVFWNTPMLDSIFDVINAGEFDWKIITILSDGEDNESKNSIWDVISEAKQRNITINVIGIWPADISTLKNIAESTWWAYTFQN